jgi:hypothetical protein
MKMAIFWGRRICSKQHLKTAWMNLVMGLPSSLGTNNLGYCACNLLKFPNLSAIEDNCCHTSHGDPAIQPGRVQDAERISAREGWCAIAIAGGEATI